MARIGVLVGVLAAWLPAAGALALEDRVVVVTSYPEEVSTRFETAFEKAHPGTDVQIVWKQVRDAAADLSRPDQGGVDVYWAPALTAFPTLRDAGAFRPLAVDRTVLPGRIGAQRISDPEGCFEAFEVAGYGIVSNPAVLAGKGLPAPATWRDLADPRYAGGVVLPVASRVGFSPALYDVILQAEGWTAGWALVGEVAANASLAGAGPAVTDGVVEAAAAAPTIDFFPRTQIANGHDLRLVYPPRTAFLPAHVAITRTAPHAQAAAAFVDFALSRPGQEILFHPDVRRYPVRPDAYATAPAGQANPFQRAADDGFAYDTGLGIDRAALIAALFDRMVTERHDRLKTLWPAIRAAEAAAAADPAQTDAARRARALAATVPVSDADARDPAILAAFRDRHSSAEAEARAAALEASWTQTLDTAQAAALELAGRVRSGKTQP